VGLDLFAGSSADRNARRAVWHDRSVISIPASPARAFASDNSAGAHPAVIAAISNVNEGHLLAYGQDEVTASCEARFRDLFGSDVVTRLTFNGTGSNLTALATMLGSLPGPNHAVVCTSWAHIHSDETGAPERLLGTKLIGLRSSDAKIAPDQLAELAHLQGVQHHVQPGVVSITQATELGTLYSSDEVAALCEQAHRMGLLVHLDGARIANATAALGGTREALRSFTIDAGVDVVSFGGTKNGLLGAEAVVFLNPAAAVGSEYVRKQVTQLPSKMRYLAAQFNAVLDDDLWIDLAMHANSMAGELHRRTKDIDGVELGAAPVVNSLFPILPPAAIEPLRQWCFFWDWDVSRHQVRWMTAWDTTLDDVAAFADGVRHVVADAIET
jgi:threonine aldolase